VGIGLPEGGKKRKKKRRIGRRGIERQPCVLRSSPLFQGNSGACGRKRGGRVKPSLPLLYCKKHLTAHPGTAKGKKKGRGGEGPGRLREHGADSRYDLLSRSGTPI